MAQEAESSRWLTKQQVAELLQVSKRTIERMVERGELPRHYVHKRLVRFRQSEIEAYMEEHRK